MTLVLLFVVLKLSRVDWQHKASASWYVLKLRYADNSYSTDRYPPDRRQLFIFEKFFRPKSCAVHHQIKLLRYL